MSNPSLRRRTWLGLGLASGAALALAGWGLAAAPSGPALAPTGALSPAVQVMLRTLGGEAVWGGRPLTVTQAWDGRDAQGQVLPEGRYEARLSAVTLPG